MVNFDKALQIFISRAFITIKLAKLMNYTSELPPRALHQYMHIICSYHFSYSHVQSRLAKLDYSTLTSK